MKGIDRHAERIGEVKLNRPESLPAAPAWDLDIVVVEQPSPIEKLGLTALVRSTP